MADEPMVEQDAVRIARLTQEVAQLHNGLKWIQHIAALHYMGRAFDPQHMRSIAVMAQQTRDGTSQLRDYDETKAEGLREAHRWAEAIGIELITDEDLDAPDSTERIARKMQKNARKL